MRAVIFANGSLFDPESVLSILNDDDLIIAANGGALHCSKLGIIPNVIIGDFDSLSAFTLNDLEDAGGTLIRHAERKDETDLELAIMYASQQGAEEIRIVAGLGQRWDQTIANITLLAHPDLKGIDASFMDGNQEIFLIHAGETREINGKTGDTLSLIPFKGDASGITTSGLEYPLNNGVLKFASSMGVSNVLIEEQASIELATGLLLCVLIHHQQHDETQTLGG